MLLTTYGPRGEAPPHPSERGRTKAASARGLKSPHSPVAESRRRIAQPFGLSNNIAPQSRQVMPEDIFAQLAGSKTTASIPAVAQHHLHRLDTGLKSHTVHTHAQAHTKPGALPQLPNHEHARSWLPNAAPDTLSWLRSWLPLRLIPIFSAIPGVVGGLKSAQSMAAFRAQLEERSVVVARQLLALGPVPEDDARESQAIRERQLKLLVEQEGLRSARRAANFHLAALGVELVCIVVATLPTLIVSMRLAGQGRLIRALGVTLRALLLLNGVLNIVRFGWGLYPLIKDAQRAKQERPTIADETWLAWEQEIEAERSYMARQLAAWSALTLGIVGVSGLIAAPWAAVLGAILLTIGIVTTTAQHLLEGRRFDLPQALWAQPAPPAPHGPCSVFGALAFDAADRICLDKMLAQQEPHLLALREKLKETLRPSVGRFVGLMPHLLRFEGLQKPFGLLLRFGQCGAPAGFQAAIISAHLALWEQERELLEGAIQRRRARMAEVIAPMCMFPMPSWGMHPDALEYAQAIDEAESEVLEREVERLDELERQLCAPRPDDPPPMHVMADAWGLSRQHPELLGALVWQMHAQHGAWRTGLLWCVKMAVLADPGDALSEALGSPRAMGSFSPA